jgi:hypothetical protein
VEVVKLIQTSPDKAMQVKKSLETPIQIQGIDASDLGLSLVLWISSCILMSILRSLFQISPYYYLISFVSLIAILIALKKASKKKHPSYLRSAISWLFLQANQIEMQQPKIFNH